MGRLRIPRLVLCLAVCLAPAAAPAAPAALETCAACHGADGMGQGNPMVPVLAGIPAAHIEEAIFTYIDRARRCVREPRMCEAVEALSVTEVAEIAKYFASHERGPSKEDFDEGLAAQGAILHQKHCSNCHVPPDDQEAAYAVGIPLHGQRSEYLRFAIEAYQSGNRESLLDSMAKALDNLAPGDIGALVNYYASYRAEEPPPPTTDSKQGID